MQTLIENINTVSWRSRSIFGRDNHFTFFDNLWGFGVGSWQWFLILTGIWLTVSSVCCTITYSMAKKRGASWTYMLWGFLGLLGILIAWLMLRNFVAPEKENDYSGKTSSNGLPSNWQTAAGTPTTNASSASPFANSGSSPVVNTQARELELLRLKDAGIITESEYLELSKKNK